MKKVMYSGLWIIIILIILAFSCDKDGKKNPTGPSVDTDTFIIEKVSISLSIPSESTLKETDLSIVTFADEISIGSKGTVSVSMPKVEKCQVVFVTSVESDNPVYLGIRYPSINKINISVNSTALALTMFNPFLFCSDRAVHDEYISAVLTNRKFDDLLTLLYTAYNSDANSALDYATNPDIYQLAVELMVEASGSLGLGVTEKRAAYPEPYIEDNTGNIITFENPTHVWYGAGIYPDGKDLKEVVTIPRKQKIISLSLEDVKTDKLLEDGYYEICITKGFDYSKFTRWDDPEGRATILNTAQAIIYIVETGIGEIPHFNENLAATFPDMINISPDDISNFNEALRNESTWGLFKALLDLLDENRKETVHWIWKKNLNSNIIGVGESSEKYIGYLTDILLRFQELFPEAGWADEHIPFIGDMIQAPEEVTYYFTQENGDITSWDRKFSASGRILEDGSGLSGVSVRISGSDTEQTVISGPDGSFSFSLLEADTYTFTITKNEYSFSYSIFKVQISDTDVTLPDIIAIRTNGGSEPHDIHGITFVSIPGGSFQMGDVEDAGEPDEKPVHFVTLDGFEMSAHEITNAQYAAYLNAALASGDITTSSLGITGKTGDYSGKKYAEIGEIELTDSEILNHPVTNVTWFGAKAFALYYGFDLPTEAEWEYAARGGKQHEYGTNDGTLTNDNAAINLTLYNIKIPKDVGSYPPNPFGLYDMCCSVMEWCDDGYDSGYYSRSPSTNPRGTGSFKVIRDGNLPYRCRAAARGHAKITTCYSWIGFRVVRRP